MKFEAWVLNKRGLNLAHLKKYNLGGKTMDNNLLKEVDFYGNTILAIKEAKTGNVFCRS